MCVQKWKFVASAVPYIIGGSGKISADPGYAHASFFSNALGAPKVILLIHPIPGEDGKIFGRLEVG